MSAPKTEANHRLDTSGQVPTVAGSDTALNFYAWDRLDAFTQGYVEALFAAHSIERTTGDGRVFSHGAFDMLAPETLARIIADCARKVEIVGPPIMKDGVDIFWTDTRGARFWRERQADECGENFPPLTVQLGDDGKVRFA